jgi:hypothetical protein
MLQRVTTRERPPYPTADRSAFCDFAAGGDENVLAVRDGDYVRVVAAWRDPDTAAAEEAAKVRTGAGSNGASSRPLHP